MGIRSVVQLLTMLAGVTIPAFVESKIDNAIVLFSGATKI